MDKRQVNKVGMRTLRMDDYDQLAKSFRRIYGDSSRTADSITWASSAVATAP